MNYYANFSAGNGTHLAQPIESGNLQQIIRDIREMAEGNRQPGTKCSWSVYNSDGLPVAQGGMNESRKRYRDL